MKTYFKHILLFLLVLNSISLVAQEISPSSSELGLMKGFPPPIDKVVDATNWTLYPNNRWGFLNVQRFHATAIINKGLGETYCFNKTLVPLDNLEISVPGNTKMDLKGLLEMHNTDAIVVLYKGNLVYERYWNGMTPDQAHWMASTSKSIIGTVAAILIERGVLDEQELVKDIIPELNKSGFGDATVRQILDMTAGTAWDESMNELLNPQSLARQYGAASGSWKIKGYEGGGVFDFLPSIEQNRKHGESFLYNSPQVDVLGWILNRITGKTLEQNVADELWKYLGATSNAYYLLDGAGFSWPTGGMNSGIYDLAKFGLLMQQNGRLNGIQVFPETVTKDIIEGGDVAAFKKGSHADLYPNGAYRNYWWIMNDKNKTYLAKGIFGQYIYINPTQEVVIVRLASEKESANRERMIGIEAAFNEIANYLNKE